MPYDLMLLADPGPERPRVLQVLQDSADFRPDAELDNRFWMTTDAGEAQVNFGTKDPVESVHVEFEIGELALAEAVTMRTFALAGQLEMRVEDVQYGHEIDEESLPGLRAFWKELFAPRTAPAPSEARPWWRVW